MFSSITLPITLPKSSSPQGIALRIVTPLIAGAMVLGICGSLFAAPEPTEAAAAVVAAAPRAVSSVVAHPAIDIQLPLPAALPVEEPVAEEPVAEPAAAQAPASWSIGITAVGLQDALDQCQWVRMDFSAAVPLPVVGAHNYCGGDIVLSMGVGETVTLAGAGLDGTYIVTGSRDAWSDSPAAEAIAGMGGDVILQTCYWVNDGSERLVSLQRV